MAPETPVLHAPDQDVPVPSMRPGQDGPGNVRQAKLQERDRVPSMRPGQDGPGNAEAAAMWGVKGATLQ